MRRPKKELEQFSKETTQILKIERRTFSKCLH